MNNLLPIVGIVLLIAVGVTFILPPDWQPSLMVRMVMGGAGTLALLFSVIGRRQPPG